MSSSMDQFMQMMNDTWDRQKRGGGLPEDSRPYGGNAITWSNYLSSLQRGKFRGKELRVQNKETTITAATETMYGCTGIFGLCGPDDVIGLSMYDDPLVS